MLNIYTWCSGVDLQEEGVVEEWDCMLWSDEWKTLVLNTYTWCSIIELEEEGVIEGWDHVLWSSVLVEAGAVGGSGVEVEVGAAPPQPSPAQPAHSSTALPQPQPKFSPFQHNTAQPTQHAHPCLIC